MSVFEVRGGRITHQYLMRKTKSELAYMMLDLLKENERLHAKAPSVPVDAVGKVVERPKPVYPRPVTMYMGPGED